MSDYTEEEMNQGFYQDEDEDYICILCGKEYRTLIGIKNHVETHKEPAETAPEPAPEIPDDGVPAGLAPIIHRSLLKTEK